MKLRISIFMVVFLAGATACRAKTALPGDGMTAPVEFEAALDKAAIPDGETAQLTLTLRYKTGIRVQFPPVGRQIEALGVTNHREEPERVLGLVHEKREVYTLKPLVAGSYTVPELELGYRDVAGMDHSLKTGRLFLEVLKPDEKAAALELRDIKPPLEIPFPYKQAGLIAGLVLLTAAMGWAAWRIYRRPKKAAPPIPPHVVALSALKALRLNPLLNQSQRQAFCFALSEICRRYTEAVFFLPAVERTTQEIRQPVLDSAGMETRFKDLFLNLLEQTDQVKFADYEAGEQELAQWFGAACTFVDGTRPRVVEPAAARN